VTERHYETPFDQALDIGGALLARRVLPNIPVRDWDDERQAWAVHLWNVIDRYDPAKGAVSTWTYRVFSHWTWERMQVRNAVRDNEISWDPSPVDDRGEWLVPMEHAGEWLYDATPPAPWSDEAHELLELLPERLQPAIALQWGEGLSTHAVADILDISTRTVNRHRAEAERFVEELRAA
jgi:DNA-directed RNA polymerase specialized sigma24 family protein